MSEPKKSERKRKGGNRGEPREAREFEEHTLQLDRVTRVVKGGRRMRFRATVIIGDRAGRVGLGLGKGNDVQIAVRKAVNEAKKHLITIPVVNDTIPHEVHVKFKAAKMVILPAVSGTGLIAGGSARKILELAGVKNVLSKNFGTSNRVVTAQATMRLLAKLRMTEAAKKFLNELKNAKSAEKARAAAKRAEAEGGPATAAAATAGKLKEAAKKSVEEKGRLEQELGSGQ